MPRAEKPQYENFQKMIQKRAWSFAQSYGIEHDELVSEGNLIFVKACRTFDGGRARFSTFLWRCLTTGLLDFCRRQRRQAEYTLTADGELPDGCCNSHLNIARSIFIRQSIAALPASGYRTMHLLINEPERLGIDGSEPPRVICAAVRNHLRAQGESWSVTRGTLAAIKSIYQEAC